MNFRDLLNIFEENALSQTISGKVTQPQAAAAAAAASAAPPANRPAYKGSQDAQAIARASGVKNVNVIKPDQVLTLPDGGSYTVQKGDTLDKIARRNPAAGPAAIAPTISDRAKDPNVAGVAKAAPIVEPAAPAAGTDAGTVQDERAAAALAAKPAAPVVATGDNASATAADARAAVAMAAKPAAAVADANPLDVTAAAGNSKRPLAFDQARGSSARTPEAPVANTGGPPPASYMYQAGKANPDYETGAGQPQWVTMNDVNSNPAAPSGNAVQRSITAPQDAAMPLPANVGNMSPADAATELRAAQAGAGKPVLDPDAKVVGTGTGGSTTTGTGGLLTTRSPDEIAWNSNKSNYGKQYPGAEAAAQQAADQKAAGDRNLSRVKDFFGFGDKSKAADNPNIGVKSNMAQNRMRESDDALSELMRLSGRTMQEKAPPGAKAERQVKHVKAGYAKDGKLTNKEKSIAYATAWKQHNKSKVSESVVMLEAGSALEHIIKKFKHETKNFLAGNDLDSDLYEALFDYYSDNGEIPYGVAKARDGDPIQWVSDRFADEMQMHGYGRQTDMLNMPGHDHELTELARLAGLSESQVSECGDMDSMEQHDSMSVSTNMSSDGTKSVNISAQGDRADSLLQMLKMAGMRPYDDHEHAGMTEPEVIMISSEPQHDDMHDSMMHDEMMDEEYANSPDPVIAHGNEFPSDTGNDMHRPKDSFSDKPYRGDNPMAEEVALDEELQSLLDSILIKDGIKVGPMGGPDDISKVHVPYVEPKSKYSSSVLDAEKPYRDEKTGKMITPPRGATMPPPDSQYAPGDQRNMMPPKRK